MRAELEKALFNAGFTCPPEALAKLVRYYDLLISWNRHTNLTSLTEPGDFINKHILDSLYPAPILKPGSTLVDVGTGAGFPGLPLKVLCPELDLTLVEAAAKKVAFLEHTCAVLNVESDIVKARAEDLGRGPRREQFDYAISRAVAGLTVICEYCLPLLRMGGLFVAMKGPGAEGEIRVSGSGIKELGGLIRDIENYQLPTGDQRCLITIEKVSVTPAKYPRRPGVPAKKPL